MEQFVYKTPSRCWPKPCAIGTVYQPTISSDMQFYALSAFVYGANALRATNAENKCSPMQLREAAIYYCTLVNYN